MNVMDCKYFTYDDLGFINNGSDKTLKILYYGTLVKRFRLHYVVEALKIVTDSNLAVEFHIYGNNESDYATELKSFYVK